MIASLALLGTGIALTPFITRLEQLLLLWGTLVGTGTGLSAIVLGATVVHRWFDRYRGVILGVLSASTATGQLLFLPLLANLTVHYGWRIATWAIAAVIAAAIPFVALLMRDSPRQLGLRRLGSDQDGRIRGRESDCCSLARLIRRNPESRFLVVGGQFLRMWRQHEWISRNPPHSGLRRSRVL
jgi:sugar phosphate permease